MLDNTISIIEKESIIMTAAAASTPFSDQLNHLNTFAPHAPYQDKEVPKGIVGTTMLHNGLLASAPAGQDSSHQVGSTSYEVNMYAVPLIQTYCPQRQTFIYEERYIYPNQDGASAPYLFGRGTNASKQLGKVDQRTYECSLEIPGGLYDGTLAIRHVVSVLSTENPVKPSIVAFNTWEVPHIPQMRALDDTQTFKIHFSEAENQIDIERVPYIPNGASSVPPKPIFI